MFLFPQLSIIVSLYGIIPKYFVLKSYELMTKPFKFCYKTFRNLSMIIFINFIRCILVFITENTMVKIV